MSQPWPSLGTKKPQAKAARPSSTSSATASTRTAPSAAARPSAWGNGGAAKSVSPSPANTAKPTPVAMSKPSGAASKPPASANAGAAQPMAWNRVVVRVASRPTSQPTPQLRPQPTPSNAQKPRQQPAPSNSNQKSVDPKAQAQSGTKSKKKKPPKRDIKSTRQQQPSSKKRKPTLGSGMNMGDMIPKNSFSQKKAPPPAQKKSNQAQNPEKSGPKKPVLEASDFPALSASGPTSSAKNQVPQRPRIRPPSVAAMKRTDGGKNSNNKTTNLIMMKKPPKQTSAPPPKVGAKRAAHPTLSPTAGGSRKGAPNKAKVPGNRPHHHHNHSRLNAPLLATEAAGDRDLAGGEHDLLRLMQQGMVSGAPKKGRQRIRPRKKKFSSLKKKVLEERFRKWRELHPDETAAKTKVSSAEGSPSSTVLLRGFADPDEVEDDDEFEELFANLRDMAEKVGQVQHVLIPRSKESLPSEGEVPTFVCFADSGLALAAAECWNDLVLGGSKLSARVLLSLEGKESPGDFNGWKEWCENASKQNDDPAGDATKPRAVSVTEIVLENALTEDDLEDEECMEESLSDVKALASKFGNLESLRVEREPAPRVILCFWTAAPEEVREIAENLNKVVIGGTKLIATIGVDTPTSEVGDAPGRTVVLSNVLTEDDVEDDDCLQESLDDLCELASQFGSIEKLDAHKGDMTVSVVFGNHQEAVSAKSMFNGMIIGGISVSASLPMGQDSKETPAAAGASGSVEAEATPTTMFSGDKRIPERFAECKRVPKIANSGKPRNYALLTDNDKVKPLLSEMLAELMRLQKRAIEDKNAKARRRLVMGLREVARGIRSHKVKMVVMANNLDDYGVIDEKLQEIIDLSQKEDVPVFFEFSKRTLGKAIGKSIKVAVVGVQNADGAHQQFKKLVNLAPTPQPSP